MFTFETVLLACCVEYYLSNLHYRTHHHNCGGLLEQWNGQLLQLASSAYSTLRITSLRVQPVLPYRFCTRKTIHWLLQSVASACVLLGVVLQYISREMKHKRHIDTVHSIVGLISVVLVAVSLASGVAALLGWQWRKYLKTVWLYRVHRAVGAAGFLAGLVALALAYEKRIFTDHFSEATRLALTIATSVTDLIVCICYL
uniref:ascorbate ferrireductase (transmembrane) n=1 Tax=Anopheles epiroticus TaxID=199890 RepID=A0A182PVQ6_9DIPT